MNRRRFAFWVGMGLFGLSEKLRADGLDQLAALAMRATEPKPTPADPTAAADAVPAEHWTLGEDSHWRWFEREELIDGEWRVTGITTPVKKMTGERYTEKTGYLPDELVPVEVRRGKQTAMDDSEPIPEPDDPPSEPGEPLAVRRARHGRPPSKWLRSLNAEELRTWMATVEIPEAGVSGMTFWNHLTRDHGFGPKKIEGLNEEEQAKLHAAAHYGY
ncbi:hypothetical protein KOR34_48830 [Posidoniimonas corsicana]|uniref:Uncharacterized protein n=1 Tax=Posidoniimonas corsicana TaxID=1938618 RepID=A0A5C5UY02_9BACT|nr:hypothetical protein [Posidoniimonas corsicana]TWT30325.1 hypothetical protein KOR34_48830 [Posidoniimonas corsicana]